MYVTTLMCWYDVCEGHDTDVGCTTGGNVHGLTHHWSSTIRRGSPPQVMGGGGLRTSMTSEEHH